MLLLFLTLILLFHCSMCWLLACVFWMTKGRRTRRKLRRRRGLYVALFLVVLLFRFVLPPAMSREDSLDDAMLPFFWGTPHISIMRISFNLCAPPLCSSYCSGLTDGKSATLEVVTFRQPFFIDFDLVCYGCGIPLLSWKPDLESQGWSNSSSLPSGFTNSIRERTTLSAPSCSSEPDVGEGLYFLSKSLAGYLVPCSIKCSPAAVTLSGEVFVSSDNHFILTACYVFRVVIRRELALLWVWSISNEVYTSSPKSIMMIRRLRLTGTSLVCVTSLKISDGFIGVYTMQILLYLSFKKKFVVDSPLVLTASSFSFPEESVCQPCLLSMNGDVFSGPIPSYGFNSLTGLLSCGAVCTGPEDAIKITAVILVGEVWLLTSLYVTIFLLSDIVVKVPLTQSSFVSISQSPSLEDLSILGLYVIVLYVFSQEDGKFPLNLYPNKFD